MPRFDPNAYDTVDSRIQKFYADHPHGRITTKLADKTGEVGATRWIVLASVWRSPFGERPDGTGIAFEVDGGNGANSTSALENCETSAIGRALANIGYSGAKRPSREEMAKTNQQPAAPATAEPPTEWRKKILDIETIEKLQEFYETDARNWYTDPVNEAFQAHAKTLRAVK